MAAALGKCSPIEKGARSAAGASASKVSPAGPSGSDPRAGGDGFRAGADTCQW